MKVKVLMAALCLCTAACSGGPANNEPANNGSTNNGGKSDEFGDETMCAAIRGNGQLITAHFGSLARITEHYGPLHAVAGGSSGSITSFMLSSMQANALTTDCNGDGCTDRETADRLALFLKSFQGYLEFLATTDEAVAAQAIAPLVTRVQEQGIEALLEEDADAGLEALQTILESEDIAALINPEILALINDSPSAIWHAQDLVQALKTFGSFDTADPMILIRPGFVSFPTLSDRLGMAASFYAGYGTYDAAGVEQWMNDCAEPGRGMSWSGVRSLPSGDSTCGEQFVSMLGEYRANFGTDDAKRSRADDNVGTYMPALISTSVLTGDAVNQWEAAREEYNSGSTPTLTTSFDDIRFGYWGPQEATAKLTEVTQLRDDRKSQMAYSLGNATWREVITYSPAEPGLARALEITDAEVSAGGWSDLSPTLILRDIGCDKIVYVTRRGPASRFGNGVAQLLGMDEYTQQQLYDLGDPSSSFSRSLAEADAVWCTDWDNQEALQVEAVIQDSYNAPMQTTDPFFTDRDAAYENIVADTGLEGCTVPK